MRNLIKEQKTTIILTSLVCLIPLIAGAILYPQLPDEIATHWDAAGKPNDWSSKSVGVFVFPGGMLLLNLLMPLLLNVDPRKQNMGSKLVSAVLWLIPIVSLFASGITLVSALGISVPIGFIVCALMGLIFIILGNYMPKTHQNYTIGIRIPWTLHSEENWNRTHRFGGFIWIICGFLVIICGFFSFRVPVMTILLLIAVLLPCIYSYLLFRKGI